MRSRSNKDSIDIDKRIIEYKQRKQNMIFAAFAIATLNGQICATTRPDGSIGLPGGKVDPGESPSQCAFREAGEEGWDLSGGHADLVHESIIEGKLVQWFKFSATPVQLSKFKEIGRIKPILVNPEQLTGFGNPEALAAAGITKK